MIILIIVLIISASPHNPGVCTIILTLASLVLIGVTLPFSLVFCLKVNFVRIKKPSCHFISRVVALSYFQVVQEYERAVIFRLGRLRKGGCKVVFQCYAHHVFGI